ncbi:MAG TPA: phosphatidylglycerophosphatase A [Bryobacteraceae bacterium]|jgi:phosphatidylglycerophosphatase A|nr:phosphatidylglycerophosphatase A [Bryobacteraceae bacterium]
MKRNPAAFLVATWFGCGYAPVGPGTAGSAAAVLIAWAAAHWFRFAPAWLLLWVVVVSIAGIPAATAVARAVAKKDPGLVVVDEVAGQWLTLAAAPVFSWQACLAAFLLFRLFDIWKPPPVRQLERLPEGAGIVADDLMAGAYGAILLLLMRWFNLHWLYGTS